MHRWTLLAILVAISACKDVDPGGPMTGESLATPGDSSDGPATTMPDEGTAGVTTNPDPSMTGGGSTGPGVSGTESASDPSASDPSASSPSDPTNDPTNGPDPTETAFILPMTDEGGDPSGDPSSDPTNDPSGDPMFGQCGWSASNNYYDCSSSGGAPGVSDPSATYPIDCPDGLQEGAPCDEQNGPIGNVGCCDPGGTLYYCTSQGNTIVKQECGG